MNDTFRRDVLFARMIGILTPGELDLLERKSAAIPGCGGVGYTHAECLVRMGIGRVNVADFDEFSPENMGRQFGATIHTVGKNKVEVLRERLTSINPALRIETFDGVREDNIERFLDGVDIVCDAIDYFAIASRRLLYAAARQRDITVIIAGPIGFGANLHIFDPRGMSFDEYFDLHAGQSEDEMLLNFAAGLNPAQLYRYTLDNQNLDFKNRTGSVLSSTCLLCTALVGSTSINHLLGRRSELKPVPYVYQLDLGAAKMEELHIPGGVRGIRENPKAYLR